MFKKGGCYKKEDVQDSAVRSKPCLQNFGNKSHNCRNFVVPYEYCGKFYPESACLWKEIPKRDGFSKEIHGLFFVLRVRGGRFVMVTTEPLSAWSHCCNGCRMNVERSDEGLQWISSNVEQSDGQL